MKKVLVTDDVHPLLMKGLENMGFTCFYQPDITNEAVHEVIDDYEGLIINSKIMVDKALLDAGVKLRFVGRVGSGMEIVDKKYADEKGVAVLSSPEGNRNAVAEHALGMLLSLMHHICDSYGEIKKGIWKRDENRGTELSGKTIGIIWYGNAGSTFAKLLGSFEVTVLAYDKYKSGFGKGHIKEVSLEQLCRYSNVISFHVPLTNETHHMAIWLFFKASAMCGRDTTFPLDVFKI